MNGFERAAKGTVSVVIPAYNAETTIAQTVESVLKQTQPADEIVVVDDGSTDATANLVERHFENAVVLHRKANGGASTARNVGMRLAIGEFVAFLDADDVWLPEKLEIQLSALSMFPDCDVCYADVELPQGGVRGLSYPVFKDHSWGYRDVFSRSGEVDVGQEPVRIYAGHLFRFLLYNGMILPSSAVVRNDFVRRNGLQWDEGARVGHDALFFLEASQYTPFLFVDAPLVKYRVPANAKGRLSANANNSKRIATFIQGVERISHQSGFADEFPEWVRHCLGHSYRRLGYHHLSELQLRTARPPLRTSLKYEPRHVNTYLLLLSSFLPPWGIRFLGALKRALRHGKHTRATVRAAKN